jgi:flagella basal body P-ring formation protein FlgA
MMCKDCDKPMTPTRRAMAGLLIAALLPSTVCLAGPQQVVRMWPQAVVVDDQIRLGDLCALVGFDSQEHERLRNLTIVPSPPPGGSKAISLRQLRDLVAGAGVNMAETIVKGASECGVSRPRVHQVSAPEPPAGGRMSGGAMGEASAPASLRDAVVAFFEQELSRYGGKVQIDFSPRATAALNLSGPEFDFVVRRGSGRDLGMIDVEVDVLSGDQPVQTVHLQPIVGLSRRVVVARRAINQKAPIRPEDVKVTELSFNRLDRLGTTTLDRVVGQRAKQFIPAGTMIELRALESVPLVKRGQLVDVVSRSGGITVVTTAKALDSAALGETVELRSSDRASRQMTGLVTGPRRVELRGAALACADTSAGRGGRRGGR